jgi:hypothetical protein
MELSTNQMQHLMKRFPTFELPYETNANKITSTAYNLCLAIPTGRKSFAWFTFHEEDDVCYILDLNREKLISRVTMVNVTFAFKLALGTIVYGTLITDEVTSSQYFLVEDIFYHEGIELKHVLCNEKMDVIADFMEKIINSAEGNSVMFATPVMWDMPTDVQTMVVSNVPDNISSTIPYHVHHIQYRAANHIMPHLNVTLTRKALAQSNVSSMKTTKENIFIPPSSSKIVCDYRKPQYKYPTVFQVRADIQYDIYHLFAYGKDNKPMYYNIAYIPSYRTSVFMNKCFRKIRENANLDYIEESDDEDDFQNMEEDKYVDLQKVQLMECTFNSKFKRWVPLRMVDKHNKIVHINKLT